MIRNKVPLPIRSDAYTVSGNAFAGEDAKEISVYNVVFRRGPADVEELKPICHDNRMVFYGLADFIKTHLTTPVTHADIDEAAEFMKTAHSFGGPLPFPEKLWRRVVDEYGGFLPIQIIGIEEGFTFFPGEPVIQVISEPGFGELAAFIEPLMVGMVACASARATIARHWLDACRNEIVNDRYRNGTLDNNVFHSLPQEVRDEIDGYARFMIHDFGMRASSVEEESNLLGRAHLLTFHGTDTFNAAYIAWKQGAKRPTGTSILALAHRIVQGHDTEDDAFRAIAKASREGVPVASYVADCYNFAEALGRLAVMAEENPDLTIVVRPDSGDYVQNVVDIVSKNIPNLRFINGDSMNPKKVTEIWDALIKAGHDATTHGIFGVGGFLRNSANRDTFSVAYKLAAKSHDLEAVCKLSEAIGKRSVPGLVKLDSMSVSGPSVSPTYSVEEALENGYVNWYQGTLTGPVFGRECYTPFDAIQNRCIMVFDEHWFTEDRKNDDGVWDVNILAVQQEYEDRYRADTATV